MSTPTLTIVAGADYATDEGTPIQIAAFEPTSPSSTASLAIGDEHTGAALLVASGTFQEIDGEWYAVFDLTAAQTAALAGSLSVARRTWDLLEITADGDKLVIYAGGLCLATRIIPR